MQPSEKIRVTLIVALALAWGGAVTMADPAESQTFTCETAPYPECEGTCADDQVCKPDPEDGACACMELPRSCVSSYPECDGQCPDGSECKVDPANDSCQCIEVVIECGDSPFPTCEGECPTGTECEPDPLDKTCRCSSPVSENVCLVDVEPLPAP